MLDHLFGLQEILVQQLLPSRLTHGQKLRLTKLLQAILIEVLEVLPRDLVIKAIQDQIDPLRIEVLVLVLITGVLLPDLATNLQVVEVAPPDREAQDRLVDHHQEVVLQAQDLQVAVAVDPDHQALALAQEAEAVKNKSKH